MQYGQYQKLLMDAENALYEAEQASQRFYDRKSVIEQEVRAEDARYGRKSHATAIKVAVDTRLGKDAKANAALGDNRWHMARATMYSALAAAKQNERFIVQNDHLITQNEQIITALKALKGE